MESREASLKLCALVYGVVLSDQSGVCCWTNEIYNNRVSLTISVMSPEPIGKRRADVETERHLRLDVGLKFGSEKDSSRWREPTFRNPSSCAEHAT